MYRSFFAIILSLSFFSPVFAMDTNEVETGSGIGGGSKLAFVRQRKEDPRQKVKYKQDVAFAQALRADNEKDRTLPSKKAQLKQLKKEWASQQKKLDDYEQEERVLKGKLIEDSSNKNLLTRCAYLTRKIEKRQSRLDDLGNQIHTLEEEIGSEKGSIQKVLANTLLFKELLNNRGRTASTDETGELYAFRTLGVQARLVKALSALPTEILEVILLNTVSWNQVSPSRVVPVFPSLWEARLVSKFWNVSANNVIKAQKLVTAVRLRAGDMVDENRSVVLSAVGSLSLRRLFFVGRWNAAGLERASGILSAPEFSQLTSLNYMVSGREELTAEDDLGTEGTYHLSRTFKYFPQLEELNIEGGELNEESVRYIAGSLHYLPLLKRLKLYASGMGPLGVKKLAKRLHHLPLLEDLYLWGSHPGDVGALALAKNLKVVLALKRIFLGQLFALGPYEGSKVIRALGLKKLADACVVHPSITFIDVRGHDTSTSYLDNLRNRNGQVIVIEK